MTEKSLFPRMGEKGISKALSFSSQVPHPCGPPPVPGPDIWGRSTCPWELFSEEGLSNPDDTHANTCHTSATGHSSCKHCKNPRGCHPRRRGGKVRKTREKVSPPRYLVHRDYTECFQQRADGPETALQQASVGKGVANSTNFQLLHKSQFLGWQFNLKFKHEGFSLNLQFRLRI